MFCFVYFNLGCKIIPYQVQGSNLKFLNPRTEMSKDIILKFYPWTISFYICLTFAVTKNTVGILTCLIYKIGKVVCMEIKIYSTVWYVGKPGIAYWLEIIIEYWKDRMEFCFQQRFIFSLIVIVWGWVVCLLVICSRIYWLWHFWEVLADSCELNHWP